MNQTQIIKKLSCWIMRALLGLAAGIIAREATTVALASVTQLPSTTEQRPLPEARPVQVLIRREGDISHFVVKNDELCEVTMTFEVSLQHLNSNVGFPYTAVFPPGETEAFVLTPASVGQRWEYSYTNYYKLGSNRARPDAQFVYELPYAPGRSFKVTQGFNGTFSHKGSNQYAIDWQMPEGTPVYAARGGVVIKVKNDSDKGGGDISFDCYNNYVLIQHSDGTLGHYCHLQKGGCSVKPGQVVQTGQQIARSGNTGFSSGPHLHFCVFKTVSGRERDSVPIKFRTAEQNSAILVMGQKYQASARTLAAQLLPNQPRTARGMASAP